MARSSERLSAAAFTRASVEAYLQAAAETRARIELAIVEAERRIERAREVGEWLDDPEGAPPVRTASDGGAGSEGGRDADG